MTGYRTPLSLLVLALAAAGGGCAVLPAQRGVAPGPSQSLTTAKPLASKTVDEGNGEENMLAAVEDFLERTTEYAVYPEGDRRGSLKDASAPGQSAKTIAERIDDDATTLRTPASGGLRIATNDAPATPVVGVEASSNTRVAIETPGLTMPTVALPVVESISIRGFEDAPSTVADAAPTRTTNAPLEAACKDTPDLLDRFVHHLKSRTAEHDDFDAEWSYRLALLAVHRDAEARRVSDGLSENQRGLLQSLIDVARSVRRVAADPLQATEQATVSLEGLRDVLIENGDPIVSSVALCQKVVTFGVFEELLPTDFVSGRTLQMIVYLELDNFQSDQTNDNQFETRLATRIELLTTAGVSMWRHEEPEIVDRCRRRRKDFFIAQRIALPPTLPSGDYVFKLLVEDKLTGRADEATYPITLVSPVSLATGG